MLPTTSCKSKLLLSALAKASILSHNVINLSLTNLTAFSFNALFFFKLKELKIAGRCFLSTVDVFHSQEAMKNNEKQGYCLSFRSVFVVPKFAITVEHNHIVANRFNDMGRWYKDRMKWYSDQICWVKVTQVMVTCKN